MLASPLSKRSIRKAAGYAGIVFSIAALAFIAIAALGLLFGQMNMLDAFLVMVALVILTNATTALLKASQMASQNRFHSQI
jgi:hypothetical protein